MSKFRILQIEQFIKEDPGALFYANNLADHIKFHKDYVSERHKHDFFLVVLVSHGSGINEIDFNKYQINPGSIFMIRPGQTHYWELSEDIDGIIFFHNQYFYESQYVNRTVLDFPFYSSNLNPPCLYLKSVELVKLNWLFEELLMEYKGSSALKYSKLSSLLDLVYIECTSRYLLQEGALVVKQSIHIQRIKEFEELLEEHYKTNRYPSFYADLMHISPKHLNRIVKTALGKKVSEVIAERVVLEASRMIVHTKDSLARIACELGFTDYSYFSNWFKIQMSVTPSRFAKINRRGL